MIDVLLGIIVVAGMYFTLKYIGNTRHCSHNCNECRHPCHTRT